MQRCEVDLRGHEQEKVFEKKCKDPKFVVECLKKYERWRKGIGEYKWTGNPEKEVPMPFCAVALSIVIESAIGMVERFEGVRRIVNAKTRYRYLG